MSELRENLRRLIVLHITSSGYTVDELTDAAIALVLEEAAKVIENDCHDDMTRAEEAAAIRAMKEDRT
jgi:hypothetical protein